MTNNTADDRKRAAALKALDLIHDGMIVGLGTGSTAAHFVKALGEKVKAGLKITGVATSDSAESLAIEAGIPLAGIDEVPHIDITIDGADEADRSFRLIKGGGAAHLREKIVAKASRRMVAILDDSKLVDAAERALFAQVSTIKGAVLSAVKADDYAGALAKVVPLKGAVDAFFDSVMVMTDDVGLKQNRVRLLMEIASLFGTVADFSKIQASE